MESEENLSIEKQNSENNPSVGNSLRVEAQPAKPLGKGSKSPSINFTENNEQVSEAQTQHFINLALKELQLSREKLEKELEELTKKKVQIENELKSSFSGQSDAIARKVKGFQEYLTGALQDLAQ